MIAKRRVHEQFAARNRGDIDAFLDNWTDDTTYIFPGKSELSGTFHGMDEIHAWFKTFRNQFPDVHFEVKQIFVSNIWAIGASNQLAVQWNATLWDQQRNEYRNEGVTVVHIKDGK
ncbi:MAG: nuclear transport factor 2 family protein, partial [Elainellaceae cyanobacterium]